MSDEAKRERGRLVERVARAICEHTHRTSLRIAGLPEHDVDIQARVEMTWHSSVGEAEAAIRAMSEPSREATTACRERCILDSRDGSTSPLRQAKAVCQAIMGRALTEAAREHGHHTTDDTTT